MHLNQYELKALCAKAGFWKVNQAIGSAIALCEAPVFGSNPPEADTDMVGDQDLATTKWGFSYGVFQVRSLRVDKGTGRIRDEDRLVEPVFNAKSARQIVIQRGDWSAWSTFQTGQYKAYLQDQFPPPPNTHIVVSGDTLSKIAGLYPGAWGWEDLARVNGLHAPYMIRIGDVLHLPVEAT